MSNKYDYYYEMKDKKQKYNKMKIDWDLMILKAFFYWLLFRLLYFHLLAS